MKRYFSLILVAAVLICCLAVPSYAAELDLTYDLLDYTSIDGNGNNYFNASAYGSSASFTIDLPSYQYVGYVCLRYYSPSGMGDFSINGVPANKTYFISGDYVVASVYCSLNGYYDSLTITLSNNSSPNMQLFFTSIEVSNSISMSDETNANGTVVFGDGDERTLYYNSSDDFNVVTIPGSSNLNYQDATTYLSFPSFHSFDYIDCQFLLSSMDIVSIDCTFGGVIVPFTANFITNDSLIGYKVLQIRMDLTNLDRSDSFVPELTIHGTCSVLDNTYSAISILACIGYVNTNNNPIFSYFRSTWSKLTSLFSNLSFNLSSWFDSVISTIEVHSSVVVESLNNMYHNITSVGSNIVTWGSHIRNALGAVESSIFTWGQAIVDAIVGDSSQVDQNQVIDNAVQQQEQINQELNVQLDAAVQDWNDNFDSVSGGYNTGFTKSTPALIWLSDKAQAVFNNMGWFGNMFFFLGFLHVFFLLMSKSGLGQVSKLKNGDD